VSAPPSGGRSTSRPGDLPGARPVTADAAAAEPGTPPAVAPTDLARRVHGLVTDPDLGPLVALDHDGVLSPIAPTPAAAVVPAPTAAALADLARRTPVAVVSGRGLDDLVGRLGHLPLTLVAEHGLRVRGPDGAVATLADGVRPATLERLRVSLGDLLGDRRGWLVEDKGVGLAVHHRLADPADIAATLPLVRRLLEAAALEGGGTVQEGHAVTELRAAGADKGRALRWLVDRHPGRPVVMVGDDLTDEPALAVAEAAGGVGVLVADAPRASAASVRLPDTEAVTELLGALAAGLRG